MDPGSPEHQVNDLEVLRKMEDEHLRLQRQFRNIQMDRLNRIGLHPQFRRQDKLLKTLKADYISYCKDLKIARSGAHKKKDKKMKQDLKNALILRLETEQDCEGGATITQQIEELLQRNYKDSDVWRKIADTAEGHLNERRLQSEHRLVSTENKLETAQLRFNAVQAENQKIRKEINHMLIDRALFNQAWDKMIGALRKGKKFLSDLFESSTLAYDQRDEWVTKLRSIQEKGKIDQMLQIQEMRDLIKAYDHELKLYHFLATKGLTRINEKQKRREEEQERREEAEIREQYQYFSKLFEDICDYTESSDPKSIIKQFTQREQQNDSIYKLLTDFCAENEVLRRDVKRIRQDACDRRDWNENAEETRQNKLAKLQQQVEEQRGKTEVLRTNMEHKTQYLNDTMTKVADIFNMLDCSLEPFQNLLGDKHPSLYQLGLTLLLITEKIKEYKEIVCYNERIVQKKAVKISYVQKKYTISTKLPTMLAPLPITVRVPAETCPACVETRWLSRISDGIELPLDKQGVREALAELSADPAYLPSDRIHTLTDCKVPRSRAILAMRYMN
ncbi:coiled-coil domain-containing protein 63-like [Anticarsia gemmatalis]|uniref:coiled-coil domain-containing protein 63-like n=1 Tax=Anticarsia gemmatalis TaxID=129554 RepID=UPI003F777E26